jgi:hypothetical protein
MSEQNKEIVRRYLREVVSAGELTVADELIDEQLVFTSPYTPGPTRDRDAFKQMIVGLHAAFPDFYLNEDHELVPKNRQLDVAVQIARGAADQPHHATQQEIQKREEHGSNLPPAEGGRSYERTAHGGDRWFVCPSG